MLNFVAIDFETANEQRDSACALGLAIVSNGEIIDRRYSLLNPQVNFQEYCTVIHGITEDVVRKAPKFQDIHPVLYRLLNGKTVAAHNALFDVGVLRASCESRKLKMPNFIMFDSVDMSRKAWPELPHHRLNYLAEEFNLPLKHHNAVEDATACALLILTAAKQFEVDSIEDLKAAVEEKAIRTTRAKNRSARRRQKLIARAKQELAHEQLQEALLHKQL